MAKYKALTLVKMAGAKADDPPVYHQPGSVFEANPKDMIRVVQNGGAEPVKSEPKPVAPVTPPPPPKP